jgi:hypothetical protein
MRYTIPQLEGLAEALSDINEEQAPDTKKDEEPLTGKDAVKGLRNMGLLR